MESVKKTIKSPEHRLISQYMEIMKLHRTILEREFNKTGVYRSQHQILMYLSDHSQASQKEIADRHHVSTSTIAVSLKKLEKGGYISRIVDQSDNRYNQINLTDRGRQVVEKSRVFFQMMEESMFRDFNQEDFKVMEQLFDKLNRNLVSLLPETEREDET